MIIKILLASGALMLSALLFLAIQQQQSNTKVTQIWQTLQTQMPSTDRFTPDMVADQPEPVQRYFLHAIAPDTALANSVHLPMQGTMRLAPDQDWMPVQAEELISHQGFVWKAVAGKGIFQMRGADYYTQNDGEMRFSLLGLIPLVQARNPDVMRSAIGRWAGEFFWLPSALLPQRGVSWRVLDQNTIQASLKADGVPITLTFAIDGAGRLLQASVRRWGDQTEDKHYTEIPFGGHFQAEQTFGGYTIPTQMGAGWWIGSDRYFEFFRIRIETANFQ
jgi:hypothetical protein